jgi:hypothetical protein
VLHSVEVRCRAPANCSPPRGGESSSPRPPRQLGATSRVHQTMVTRPPTKKLQNETRKRAHFGGQFWKKVLAILAWTREEFYGTLPRGALSRSVFHFLSKAQRVYEARGRDHLIAYIKRVMVLYLQYLAAPEGTREEWGWRRKVRHHLGRYENGKALKGGYRRDYLRFVLTALITSRCLKVPGTVDPAPIVTPSSGEVDEAYWRSGIDDFRKRLGFGRPSASKDQARARWTRWHASVKKGPNGPALWYALADLACLPDKLRESIGFLGGEELSNHMETLRRNLPALGTLFPISGKNEIRRLVGIPDAGKSRTVAMLDYFSQAALKPVHTFLFGVLKKIPQDVTFDQGSFLGRVQGWGKVEYFSVDLSKATDRFPIKLISLVLEAFFTKEWVSHWVHIMVGYPFSSEKGPLSYAVGNPMGAYSSWASFAVAHHYVMFMACRKARVPWETSPYVILGDDVLIGHRGLAEAYKDLISQLGVEVSAEKTLVSFEAFEFAKRYFFAGEEITPFPIPGVWDTRSSSLLCSTLLGEERRSLVAKDGIPAAVGRLLRRFGLSRPALREAREIARLCEVGSRFTSGSLTAVQFISELVRGQSARLSDTVPLSDSKADAVIRRAVESHFAASLSSPRLDLGGLAVDLVERFTGRDRRFVEDGFLLIYALPFLGVYGQVEEMYVRALKDHRSLGEMDVEGELTRSLCIPFTDQELLAPVKDLKVVFRGKFATSVLEALRVEEPETYRSLSTNLLPKRKGGGKVRGKVTPRTQPSPPSRGRVSGGRR